MSGGPVSRGLDRYLLRGERIVAQIRRHRIVLARPALTLLGAVLLAIWIDVNASGDGAAGLVRIAWLGVLGVLLWAGWRFFEWWYERFVVTDKRILLFHGFITRKVPMMPLTKVTDMTYERSILGRLLGYGTFVIESAGQDQALSRIDHVPQPDESYRAIVGEIFGIHDEPLDDDEGGSPESWDDEGEVEEEASRGGPVHDGDPARDASDEPASPGRGAPVYTSADRRRRRLDDTGEIPPYDPDWRP